MNRINLFKPVVKLYKSDSKIKLFSLKIPANKAGELNIDVRADEEGFGYRYITELKNKCNKVLGFEKFAKHEDSDEISGLYIEVAPEYRKRNYFFGEILRLASIIEMFENKVKELKITSKNSAIFFHSKYKFKPDIHSFDERDAFLNVIAVDKDSINKKVSDEAKALINKINKAESAKEQRDFCQVANRIVGEYFDLALKDNKTPKPTFKSSIDMILTSDTVKENRDFYNKLFEKHGIDYKI